MLAAPELLEVVLEQEEQTALTPYSQLLHQLAEAAVVVMRLDQAMGKTVVQAEGHNETHQLAEV